MYSDITGEFPVLISLIAVAVGTYMTYGAIKAHNTSKGLGYSGWELAGYTASGLVAGDYYVVKDNWDSISKNIVDGYIESDNPYIDFDFTKNKHYSVFTASLYAKYLNKNFYVESRTTLGMYIELQAHYLAYNIGVSNGNPAWMGPPALNGDWTAWLSECVARIIEAGTGPILPRIPKFYP